MLGERPDLVLLDLGLPDVDGLTLIGMIRAASAVPIIVITAVDDDPTMVRVARRRGGRLRREAVPPRPGHRPHPRGRCGVPGGWRTEPIRVGELVIDEPTRTATLAGEPLELARREFDLLLALAQRAGEVVSKRTCCRRLAAGRRGSDRTVDVHLSWLRRKLGETAAEPRYLQSVRGVGVRGIRSGRSVWNFRRLSGHGLSGAPVGPSLSGTVLSRHAPHPPGGTS